MKSLCFVFLSFFLLSQISLLGSDVPDDFPGMETTVLSQVGGVYLPSTGVIKALVIFIQFPDDDYVGNSAWPLNSFPLYPFGEGYLAENVDYSGNSYRTAGISHYFYEMSSGRFHVVGDVYPQLVYTPHTQAYYEANDYHYGEITREVLQALDPYIDYSEYDNWTTSGSTYSWDSGPDGKVDMIFIRYRWIDESINTSIGGNDNDKFGLYAQGIAMLSWYSISDYVTSDGDTIDMTGFPQSGVTKQFGAYCTNSTSYGTLTWSVGLDAHEFGHYILGLWHGGAYGGNGLMKTGVGWIGDIGMHSYERERLGYITFTDITANTTATISDYLTTGVAYRVQVPGGASDEYFIIENRQQLSIYDRPYSKGVVISHIKGNGTDNIDIECADGRWNWSLCEGAGTPTYYDDDRIYKDTENPNTGYDGLDKINGRYKADVTWLCDGESVELHGDEFDTYSLEGNYKFAPWTNPNTNTRSGSFTNFSVEILQKAGNNYVVYFDYDANPQTPQNFNGTWYNNHPKIYWTANTEPDFDYYEVWKCNGSSWSLKTTTTNTSYIDYSESKYAGLPYLKEYVSYKVRAVDNANQKSDYTSSKQFTVNGFQSIEKKTENDSTIVSETVTLPKKITLFPPAPNPFNITTAIKLDLPEETEFSLAIYDIKGTEVWRLNNSRTNTYPAGYHRIVWNGRDNSGAVVPTGVYFIVYHSPEHKLTQKVVLMK